MFKVGDIVKVVRVLSGDMIKPGAIGVVEEIVNFDNAKMLFGYQVKFENGTVWSFLQEELELVLSIKFNDEVVWQSAEVSISKSATIPTFNTVPYTPSRRDFFAAAAMQGKLASGTCLYSKELSELAVKNADALIAELDREKK